MIGTAAEYLTPALSLGVMNRGSGRSVGWMLGTLRGQRRLQWVLPTVAGAFILGSVPAGATGTSAVAASAGHGQEHVVADPVCAPTDRTPEADGRPFKGVKIRRSADSLLVPRGAVAVTICFYNGMNATPATPQFGLSGIGVTNRARTLARLTRELDAIRAVKPGASYHCPFDDASEAILNFGYRSGPGDVVTVGMRGCNTLTNMAMQTISYPDRASIPHHLALGAPVIQQIAALARPVRDQRWATVVGHLRLCGGPAPGRCYVENDGNDDRVVVHAAGDPWIAMAQIEHGRFHFRVAASGVYTFAFYTGNTLVKKQRARVTVGHTTRVVFLIPIP